MDVDIPSFKTSAVSTLSPAVSCKATRVERRGAVSESSTQLSCLGWGPALSLDPMRASRALPTFSLSPHLGVQILQDPE